MESTRPGLLGAAVDPWRPRQWRRPPALWRALISDRAVYFAGPMFTWSPPWNIGRAAWVIYLVLFVPSTVLNIRGHFGDGPAGQGLTPPA